MRLSEIRALGRDELEQKVEDSAEEIFKLRCQAATVQPENVMMIPQLKKTVARIKTMLREIDFAEKGDEARRPRSRKRSTKKRGRRGGNV